MRRSSKPWTIYLRALEYVNAVGFIYKIFKWVRFHLYNFVNHFIAANTFILVTICHFDEKLIYQTKAVANELKVSEKLGFNQTNYEHWHWNRNIHFQYKLIHRKSGDWGLDATTNLNTLLNSTQKMGRCLGCTSDNCSIQKMILQQCKSIFPTIHFCR